MAPHQSPSREWPLPHQQEPISERGQNLSHASKAVLHCTPRTAAPVYIKPYFVFLCRKSAAHRWRQTCLSRRVSRSLTWDLQPLVQLKTSLSTPGREWASRTSGEPARPGALPKPTGGGKVKLKPNKPFPFTLLGIWWWHPNHKSASSYVKGEAFSLSFELPPSFSIWRTGLPISPWIFHYMRPKSLCQRDVEALPCWRLPA